MTKLKAYCWLSAGALAMGGLTFGGSALDMAAEANCDATTGASVVVQGISTTLSGATVSWTERRHNGDRFFCYGEGAPGICSKTSTRVSGTNKQIVSGLKANTKYAYKFHATYKGKTNLQVVNGSFITNGTGCGSSLVTAFDVQGTVLSGTGDSVQNVIVKITNSSGGALMAQDTTDRSGGLFARLPAGTYQVALSLPPFTSPPPKAFTVIFGKPLDLGDFTLTGAFQIGGTVINMPKRDTLPGATVTLTGKSGDPILTRTTDLEGHFTFPVKAGDYSLNVSYNGKSLAAPISLTVSKSGELPDVVFSAPILGIRSSGPEKLPSRPEHGIRSYKANGARLPDKDGHGKVPRGPSIETRK